MQLHYFTGRISTITCGIASWKTFSKSLCFINRYLYLVKENIKTSVHDTRSMRGARGELYHLC